MVPAYYVLSAIFFLPCHLIRLSDLSVVSYVDFQLESCGREQSVFLRKLFQKVEQLCSLLAMAGDLGGSIGPGIVGRITQNSENNIRIGMGCGLIFPVVLLFMLFLMHRKNQRDQK